MDWRAFIFPDPAAQMYVANETSANLEEQEFFRNTLTPEIAQNSAGIAKSYPSMDPRLNMYASMAGLTENDKTTFDIANVQNDYQIKENLKSITEVSKAKRASQMGMLLLDIGFQPVSRAFKSAMVASQETGVSPLKAVGINALIGMANLLPPFVASQFIASKIRDDDFTFQDRTRRKLLGDNFADSYEKARDDYGPTAFNRAWDEYKAGRVINLGTGWMPNSVELEETEQYRRSVSEGMTHEAALREAEKTYGRELTQEFKEDEDQYKFKTKKAGLVNISPGRVVAGNFFTKEDMGYAVGSTIVDGAFRLGADPVNWLLGYASGAKTGLRTVVNPQAQAAFKSSSPLLVRLLKTAPLRKGAKEARALQFGKTADALLETKRGTKFLQALAENKKLPRLKEVAQLNKLDDNILMLLTKLDDPQDIKRVLKTLLDSENLNMRELRQIPSIRKALDELGSLSEVEAWDIAQSAGAFNKLPFQQNLIPQTFNQLLKAMSGGKTDVAKNLDLSLVRSSLSKLSEVFSSTARDDVFNGIVGLGSEARYLAPQKLSRWFDLAPKRRLSVHNLGESSNNLYYLMKSGRLAEDRMHELLDRTLMSQTQGELDDIYKEVLDEIGDSIVRANPDLRGSEPEMRKAMKFVWDETMELKKYFVNEKGESMFFQGSKQRAVPDKFGDATQAIEAAPTAMLISQFMDSGTQMIDYMEIEKTFRTFRRLTGEKGSIKSEWLNDTTIPALDRMFLRFKLPKRGLSTKGMAAKLKGGETGVSLSGEGNLHAMDMLYQDFVSNVLKPNWMLRFALTLRVTPEEALRWAFNGGRGSLRHPLQYYGLRLLPGKHLEIQDVTGDVLWSTRIKKKEYEFVSEILGDDFKKAAEIDYESVEKIMKSTKIGINETMDASDNFVTWAVRGRDGRDMIYDTAKSIKSLKPLKKDARFSIKNVNKTFFTETSENWRPSGGGTFDVKTGNIIDNNNIFGSVSPYRSLSRSVDEDTIRGIQEARNLNRDDALKYFIENEWLSPKHKELLAKEDHYIGWFMQEVKDEAGKVTGKELVFDISVGLKYSAKATGKEVETALVNLSMMGIKGVQESAYISPIAYKQILNSVDSRPVLQKWLKAIGSPDEQMDGAAFLNFHDDFILARGTNNVARKEVLESMYDTNFDVARAVLRKKRGVGNAAPSGTWMPHTDSYMTAMASRAMKEIYSSSRKQSRALKDGMKMEYKYINAEDGSKIINPKYEQNVIHQLLLHAQDPISVRIANYGVDDTVRWIMEDPEGIRLWKIVLKESDERLVESGEIAKLTQPKYIKERLEAVQWRMARLLGQEEDIYIQGRKSGRRYGHKGSEAKQRGEISEQVTGVHKDGPPLYFSSLDKVKAKSGLDFIKNSGFKNGIDFREDWMMATNGRGGVFSGKNTTAGAVGKYYKQFYKEVIGDEIQYYPAKLEGSFMSLGDVSDLQQADTAWQYAAGKWQRGLQYAYNALLTGPSDLVNRDPLFRMALYENGIDGIKRLTVTEQVAEDFARGAADQLRGSKFGEQILDDIYKALEDGKRLGFKTAEDGAWDSLDDFQKVLEKKAMDTVINLLYSTSNRHVFSDILGRYVPFPEIGAEVWKTWGGLLAKNPQAFNRSRMAFDAGEEGKPWDASMGFFFKDPKSGKTMFTYPDINQVFQKSAFGEDLTSQGVRVRPAGFLSGLNLVASNGLLPGFGPNVTTTLAFLRKVSGPLPKMFEDAIFGDFPPPKGFEEFKPLPSSAEKILISNNRFIEPFSPESNDYYNNAYSSSVIDSIAAMYAKGLIDPSDASQSQEQIDKVLEAVNNQWIIRGLAQFTLPTGIQPRIELQDKNGDWWFVQTLVKDYQGILKANNYDYQTTTDQFIDKYGINPIPLTQTKSKPRQKLPTRESAVRFWTEPENKILLDDNPTAIGIYPDNYDDPYEWTRDWDYIKEFYDPKDWDLLFRQTMLEMEYSAFCERVKVYGKANRKTAAWIQGVCANKRQELEANAQVVAFEPLGVGEVPRDSKQNIFDLYRWQEDERLKNTPEFEPLMEYLKFRDRAEYVLQNGGYLGREMYPVYRATATPLGSTREEAMKARDQLNEFAQQLISKYPDTNWSYLFYTYLYYEVNNMRYNR